ncbi:SPC12-domain-containing protein [Tothia fuscella]|uniref:Signal peptidase complex subunit 1 n=1 Tax=Tothia fuscella TaxID=1048955 RepID=A0A9P4P0Q7_9PEZI|nr:SPC12-domain-containing protein [Tothia fuscella]
MAEEALDYVRDLVEGQIDFEGQRLSELIYTVLLSLVGVVAFVTGYITQNVYNTLYVGLAGTALTFVVVVPAWPIFNKHPQRWIAAPHKYSSSSGFNVEVDGKKVT